MNVKLYENIYAVFNTRAGSIGFNRQICKVFSSRS